MKIKDKIILNHLKLSKRRTLVTIIGIILSTILISGILIIYSSFINFMKQIDEEILNNKKIRLENIKFQNLKYLKNDPFFKDNMYISKKIFNIEKGYEIIGYDKKGFLYNEKILKEGRNPLNNDEITISINYLKEGYKIGGKIKLIDFFENEKIYTIVGINNDYKMITLINKENYKTFDVNLETKSKKGIKEHFNRIKKNLNLKDNQIYFENNNIENYNLLYIVFIIILITIVIIKTSALIFTSFMISITERKKEIGILQSIGATRKQISNIFIKEGLIIALISIPIGFLISVGAINIVLKIINKLLSSIQNYQEYNYIKIIVNLKTILLSLFFILTNILIAIYLPIKKAIKQNPLELIRKTNDIKFKKIKISSIFKKIFKIEGVIVKKSIKRNKKRYIITNISLMISIIVFIVFTNFIIIIMNNINYDYEKTKQNIRIDYTLYKSDKEDQIKNVINDIKKITNVNFSYKFNSFSEISNCNLLSDEYKNNYSNCNVFLSVYTLSNQNNDLLDNEAYLYNKIKVGYSDKNYIKIFNIKEKEYISNENMKLKIKKIKMELPDSIHENNNRFPVLIVNEKTFYNFYKKKKFINNLIIEINSKNTDLIEEKINKKNNLKYEVYNYNNNYKENKILVLIVSIFLYGFLLLLTIIAIANIFNIVTSNIKLNKKEYFTMKSIGLSNKKLKRIIYYESFLYVINSLFWGIIFSVIINFLINFIVLKDTNYIYKISIIPILIIIIIAFILILITTKFMYKKIIKNNILETIKSEII